MRVECPRSGHSAIIFVHPSNFLQADKWGGGETVETFFSLWMWHHAGRPTTDNCAETIGINTYSRDTDNYTQTLDK